MINKNFTKEEWEFLVMVLQTYISAGINSNELELIEKIIYK